VIRPAVVALVVLVVAAPRATAEDPPTRELDDATIVARATAAASRLAEAEKTSESEEKALAANREQLSATRARLASLAVPEELPLAREATKAKAVQERASARHDALETARRLTEDERSLLEERARRLPIARAGLKAVAAALDDASSVGAELEARIASKRIPPEKLPATLAAHAIAERRARLAAVDLAHEKESATVARALADVPGRLAGARDAARIAGEKLAAATRAARELARREAIEKDLADRDPARLVALLATAAIDRDRLAQAHEPLRRAFEQARADVAAIQSELREASPPDETKVSVDSGPARVMAAQRTFNLVRAVADYEHGRAAQLARLGKAVGRLAETARALSESAARLDDELLLMRVCVTLIEQYRAAGKLPSDAPEASRIAALDEERRQVAADSDAATAAADDAAERAKRLEGETAAALDAEKAQKDRLGPLEAALAQARETARWTHELEALPLADVVARFSAAQESARKGELALRDARLALAAAEAAVASASAAVNALDDPFSRQARRESSALRRRILVAVSRAAGREPPPDGVVPDGHGPDGVDPLATAETDLGAAAPAKGSAALADRLEKREMRVLGREQSLEARLPVEAMVADELARAQLAAGALAARISETLEAVRRLHGAALELRMRVIFGEASEAALPPGAGDAVSDARLVALEADLAASQGRVASLQAERNRIQASRADDVRARELLARALSVIGKTVETLRERASLEATFDRPDSALGETERKRRGQEIVRRSDGDDTLTETVLALFTSERAQVLTELLRSYYGDLVENDRKRQDLVEMGRLTRDLLSACEEERKVSIERLPLARRRLVRLRADAAVLRIRYGVVAPTDEASLAELAADGAPAPRPEPLAGADPGAIADLVFAAEARALAMARLVSDLEDRLSPRGIDLDRGARQDELGAIAARTDVLARDATRIEGEVARTRQQRRSVLERSALVSLLRVFLIPLVAFVVIRMMYALARRIVKRVRDDPANLTPDREQRAQTIVHVFTRTTSGVVVVVAGIYMLKELRIDVTPILASAGVLGLAIAFGAQALVRDYFAGFFILLENQYKMGDTVKIGDSTGIVERVTLRMTVLRADDGTVFFIPNGNVQLVANLTKGWAKTVLKIGVGYDSDLDHVTAVLKQVGKELDEDDLLGGKILEMPQVLGVEDFGEDGITVSMLFRTLPNEQLPVVREARRRIKLAFDKERIPKPESPDPIRHVYPPGA
jgi:small conductance mechanosensitive channel